MTTDYLSFECRVETAIWSKASYTVLPLSAGVADHFLALGAKRVEGVIHGEPAELRLRPAPNDAVDLAPDVQPALVIGAVLEGWNALTPGKRRGLLYHIDTAKTEPTRKRRIAALAKSLSQRQVNPS